MKSNDNGYSNLLECADRFEDQANGLMDALFSDVETVLAIKASEVSQPDSVLSIIRVDTSVPALTKARFQKPDSGWAQAYVEPLDSSFKPINHSAPSAVTQPKSTVSIDSLLLGAACTSVIFAGIVWLANSRFSSYAMRSPEPILQVTTPVSDETAKFAEEMRSSLLAFTNKNTTSNPSSVEPTVKSKDQQSTSSAQPIYIPIYQPPAVATPTTPIAAIPAPVIQIPTPISSPIATSKVVPKGNYTLIGILEIGDRSSAMFDVNGSVQSVKVGGAVGDSGWSLTQINRQDVTLKRGNENTSLTVGQKF